MKPKKPNNLTNQTKENLVATFNNGSAEIVDKNTLPTNTGKTSHLSVALKEFEPQIKKLRNLNYSIISSTKKLDKMLESHFNVKESPLAMEVLPGVDVNKMSSIISDSENKIDQFQSLIEESGKDYLRNDIDGVKKIINRNIKDANLLMNRLDTILSVSELNDKSHYSLSSEEHETSFSGIFELGNQNEGDQNYELDTFSAQCFSHPVVQVAAAGNNNLQPDPQGHNIVQNQLNNEELQGAVGGCEEVQLDTQNNNNISEELEIQEHEFDNSGASFQEDHYEM